METHQAKLDRIRLEAREYDAFLVAREDERERLAKRAQLIEEYRLEEAFAKRRRAITLDDYSKGIVDSDIDTSNVTGITLDGEEVSKTSSNQCEESHSSSMAFESNSFEVANNDEVNDLDVPQVTTSNYDSNLSTSLFDEFWYSNKSDDTIKGLRSNVFALKRKFEGTGCVFSNEGTYKSIIRKVIPDNKIVKSDESMIQILTNFFQTFPDHHKLTKEKVDTDLSYLELILYNAVSRTKMDGMGKMFNEIADACSNLMDSKLRKQIKVRQMKTVQAKFEEISTIREVFFEYVFKIPDVFKENPLLKAPSHFNILIRCLTGSLSTLLHRATSVGFKVQCTKGNVERNDLNNMLGKFSCEVGANNICFALYQDKTLVNFNGKSCYPVYISCLNTPLKFNMRDDGKMVVGFIVNPQIGHGKSPVFDKFKSFVAQSVGFAFSDQTYFEREAIKRMNGIKLPVYFHKIHATYGEFKYDNFYLGHFVRFGDQPELNGFLGYLQNACRICETKGGDFCRGNRRVFSEMKKDYLAAMSGEDSLMTLKTFNDKHHMKACQEVPLWIFNPKTSITDDVFNFMTPPDHMHNHLRGPGLRLVQDIAMAAIKADRSSMKMKSGKRKPTLPHALLNLDTYIMNLTSIDNPLTKTLLAKEVVPICKALICAYVREFDYSCKNNLAERLLGKITQPSKDDELFLSLIGFIRIVYYCEMRHPTATTCAFMKMETNLIDHLLELVNIRMNKQSSRTIKQHYTAFHFSNLLEVFGCALNFDVSSFEKFHTMIKRDWEKLNLKHDVGYDLLRLQVLGDLVYDMQNISKERRKVFYDNIVMEGNKKIIHDERYEIIFEGNLLIDIDWRSVWSKVKQRASTGKHRDIVLNDEVLQQLQVEILKKVEYCKLQGYDWKNGKLILAPSVEFDSDDNKVRIDSVLSSRGKKDLRNCFVWNEQRKIYLTVLNIVFLVYNRETPFLFPWSLLLKQKPLKTSILSKYFIPLFGFEMLDINNKLEPEASVEFCNTEQIRPLDGYKVFRNDDLGSQGLYILFPIAKYSFADQDGSNIWSKYPSLDYKEKWFDDNYEQALVLEVRQNLLDRNSTRSAQKLKNTNRTGNSSVNDSHSECGYDTDSRSSGQGFQL